jgi:hypothetical protein
VFGRLFLFYAPSNFKNPKLSPNILESCLLLLYNYEVVAVNTISMVKKIRS